MHRPETMFEVAVGIMDRYGATFGAGGGGGAGCGASGGGGGGGGAGCGASGGGGGDGCGAGSIMVRYEAMFGAVGRMIDQFEAMMRRREAMSWAAGGVATAETHDRATANARTITEIPMPVHQDAPVATAAHAELSQDMPESREPVTTDASRPRLLVLGKKLKPWLALLAPMIVRQLTRLMNNDEP